MKRQAPGAWLDYARSPTRIGYRPRMPDWRDISVWLRLSEAPEVQAAAAAVDSRDAASIARLRKRYDADLVAAALELADARRKAAAKFAGAGALWCDVAGVEQASGARVASWKARRMAEALGAGGEVLDVCCGIGGDAMALARAGLRVTAVDLDERRAWMAAMNAGCPTRAVDAESLELAGAALHADPARRDEHVGSRSWSLDAHRPGRVWIERVLREARAAAVKFSPGVDRREFGDIPIAWEFIEDGGSLLQAVAWSGAFAGGECGQTRATRLDERGAESLCGAPDERRPDRIGCVAELRAGMLLHEAFPAVERAALLTEASGARAAEVARGLGLLAGDQPLDSRWFESFEIVTECAARDHALREALAAHGLVLRSVRVRGRAVDGDALTKALGARPSGDAVVFAFRRGDRATALVTRVRDPR